MLFGDVEREQQVPQLLVPQVRQPGQAGVEAVAGVPAGVAHHRAYECVGAQLVGEVRIEQIRTTPDAREGAPLRLNVVGDQAPVVGRGARRARQLRAREHARTPAAIAAAAGVRAGRRGVPDEDDPRRHEQAHAPHEPRHSLPPSGECGGAHRGGRGAHVTRHAAQLGAAAANLLLLGPAATVVGNDDPLGLRRRLRRRRRRGAAAGAVSTAAATATAAAAAR
eukprot:scaffold50191_cov65-Phaeocystis_antarctica.AAC.3